MLETATAIALLGGPILSTVVAFILGRGFSKNVGVALTILACVLAALATTFLGNGFMLGDIHTVADGVRLVLMNFVILYVSTITFFKGVAQPTGFAEKLNDSGPQVGTGTKTRRKVGS